MDQRSLDLIGMGHVGGEDGSFSPDVKLDYLAVLELDQEDFICHLNQIFDRLIRHFDDLLVRRLRRIINPKHTCLW